ncbi:hypothetical protein HanPSC8_Chr09g0351941 [Helianthus annuus]|nr:hypothetical protein HanPSC8_Chr09g0351941 [Helianthus annuus]
MCRILLRDICRRAGALLVGILLLILESKNSLIMEIEDWAGGSSDSEVSSPESDYKDHCYAYGDLPKLQFRYF